MISFFQILISVILIALILIQERSSGLSSIFGGGGGTPYQTRRGAEKIIFIATIVSAIIFLILAILNLVL